MRFGVFLLVVGCLLGSCNVNVVFMMLFVCCVVCVW